MSRKNCKKPNKVGGTCHEEYEDARISNMKSARPKVEKIEHVWRSHAVPDYFTLEKAIHKRLMYKRIPGGRNEKFICSLEDVKIKGEYCGNKLIILRL